MITELIDSFKEEIKKRTTNPFLGTFAIIWLIRNWKVVYAFFHFDDDKNLKNNLNGQLEFINNYFQHESFLWNFFICVCFTFLSLVISYGLLNLSRLIINFYDKIVTPRIYKLTDGSSVVLKEDYENLKQEKRDLEIKLEQERDKRTKAEKERNELEEKVAELGEKLNDNKIAPLLTKNDKNTKEINNRKEERSIIEYLIKENKLNVFLSNARKLKMGQRAFEGEYALSVEYFIGLGVIEIDRVGGFEVSKLGESVLQLYREEYLPKKQ